MTKEELLQYFAGLDLSALERLKKYSELLIIPDEDLLVNATMSQMVDKAHSLADVLFPEWTDRSKSDFGQFLVELFALFSEKDFWYLNAFANEGILRKMRSYSNAFSRAVSMGYTPDTIKGSSTTFNVTIKNGELATYDRGDLIISVGTHKFVNDEPFTVAANTSDTTRVLTLHEGTVVAENRTYNGYNVFIRRTNVDIDSIRVVIDNVSYTRVNNFGNSSADSTHFLVLPEEDGSCSIYFGTNGFGVQPPLGKSIRVEYRRCDGYTGNIPIGQATIADSLPRRQVIYATMLMNATGGKDAETLTSIKERAPLYFYSKRAIINPEIAERTLNSFPFIHQSKTQMISSILTYHAIPLSGNDELTATERSTLQAEFHPYVMMGFTASWSANNYVNFAAKAGGSKILINAIMERGRDRSVIESGIRRVMDDLTNPLISATYGQDFTVMDTTILMRASIPGLISIAFFVDTESKVMGDIHLSATEIFRRLEQQELEIKITTN